MSRHEAVPIQRTETLHHLVTIRDWNRHVDNGCYRPLSLVSEGFIHLSTAAQVPATVQRFYAQAADLHIVSIDATALGEHLVYEDLSGHGEFPHLYAPLPLDAVAELRAYDSTERLAD